MCGEGTVLSKHLFQHKMIHRVTWRRKDKRGEQNNMIDYIEVDEKLRKDVLDAKVVRGIFESLIFCIALDKDKGR